MADDLIAAHRDEAKLMPYLHLPFQSGADRILAAMNRKHTVADYLELVDRIRAARPDLALSTDFIVGFPGETEAEFEATLALVERVGFAQAYTFKYSPRPGTPAATSAGRCPKTSKSSVCSRLQALMERHQTAFNSALRRQDHAGAVRSPAGARPGQLIGRSPYLQSVHATADSSRAWAAS